MAGECGNVLEEVTGAMYPRIGEIERFFEQQGALVSKMSGSGPTVFAIFNCLRDAELAAQAFEASDKEKDCTTLVCDFVYRIMEDTDGRQ